MHFPWCTSFSSNLLWNSSADRAPLSACAVSLTEVCILFPVAILAMALAYSVPCNNVVFCIK